MAQEFKLVNASALPAATNITDNDMILIIQDSGLKRALPSAMKGKPGNPGASAYLGVSSTYIQWKQGPGGAWQNLLEIERLRGPKGEKPVFRKLNGTLQMRYEGEPDTAFVNIFDREELKMKFSDLTAEEVNQLKLHFSDLTDADKAELMKPATDAGAEVREKMIAIEQSATEVIAGAEAAKNTADQVIADVNTANNQAVEAENARVASELLRIEEEKKRVTAELARVEADKLRKESEDARVEAERLRLEKELERINAELARAEAETLRVQESKTAVDNAVAATQLATNAASAAQEVADHPIYIGPDHYVYKWNKETKAYDKTDIFVKGDAFSIKKVYASVSEMEADAGNAEIKEGDFVLINTNDVENPDNARLYIKTASGFDFLVDMSGAIGFTGKTPQLGIGTVSGGDAAAVSLSEDGTDSAGNPKFKLNFVLPQGKKGDTPVLSAGNVTTGAPGTPATAELVPDGATDAGIPRYRLDLTIPRGDIGSGNVSVPPAALKAGVTYLFKSSADGSAEGEFIEYVPAAQEQADWSVADAALPSFIKNKPESLPANGGNADTLGGYTITTFLTRDPDAAINADASTRSYHGFGYTSNGWPVNGSFISFGGFSGAYFTQIQGDHIRGNDIYFRTRNDDSHTWNPWRRFAITGEAQPASDVHAWAKQPVKPVYDINEILGADNSVALVEPNTIVSKTFVSTVKNGQGYVSRMNLGISNLDNRFGQGMILVGLNDEGTSFTSWCFDPYNSRITSGGHTVAFTSDTVEAANKLGNARTINGTYFDGTANILTECWGKPRTFSFVNDVAASFVVDGSLNIAPSIEVQRVTGSYSGNGGIQPPSFVPSGKVMFMMMNLTLNENTSYKDFMLMDTYSGSDVPWVTGLAIEKGSTPRAWIMTGGKGQSSWGYTAQIWTTQNFDPNSYRLKVDHVELGTDNFGELDGTHSVYAMTLTTNATLSTARLPTDGVEFTLIVYCQNALSIVIPTTGNYVSMCGNSVSVQAGKYIEFSFVCSRGKWHIAMLESK